MVEICSRDEKRDLVVRWLREYLTRNRYRSKKRRPEKYYSSYDFLYSICEKNAIIDVLNIIKNFPNYDPIEVIAMRYSWADDKLAQCRETAFNLMSILSAYENSLSDILIYIREEWRNEIKRRNKN